MPYKLLLARVQSMVSSTMACSNLFLLITNLQLIIHFIFFALRSEEGFGSLEREEMFCGG